MRVECPKQAFRAGQVVLLGEAGSVVSVATTAEVDGKALALRRQGRTYTSIARELGLDGIRAAAQAFNRDLRRQSKRQQQVIRREEKARLDAQWMRAQNNRSLTPEELERRRRGVEWHRAQLDAE
jgi:hypothetical protein